MPTSTARRGVLALLLAALILFMLGSIEMARAATHAVTIADFAFAPATVTITVGDTVTWTNEDPVVHTATSTSGAFDTGELGQGESSSVTFTTPGTYPYRCTPHPNMTGQVIVMAPAAAPTPASGGAPIPDVAMRPGLRANAALLAGLQLIGWAGLAVITRRRRWKHR
jgi:plastocyanin